MDGEKMKVTEKDLADVAVLSRLSIAEGEREKYLGQLDAFLQYVENLDGVDTAEVQPTTYALPMQNVFRADEVKPSLAREAALSNAPLADDGYFKVPKILEG
jgi:aspartyl/glutamyl-tRNA(asn/gln) amidotransferase, C subunit